MFVDFKNITNRFTQKNKGWIYRREKNLKKKVLSATTLLIKPQFADVCLIWQLAILKVNNSS